jgi:hypothetical protein
MCNAAKHSPGCLCGFGPPYPPSYTINGVTEWAEEVLDRPELVERGLRELAWDEKSIQEFVAAYSTLTHSPLPRSSCIQRVRELLGMRKKVEEEVLHEQVRVPLYRFGAPPVSGAKVEYSEGESFVGGGGWNLRFLGVGTGNTTSLDVSKSRTFVASNGACKLVYVPVTVRIARVAIFQGDQLVGRGHEAQVVSPKELGDPHLQRRGCISVAGNTDDDRPVEHYDVVDLALTGDTSGAVHKDKRSWETNVAREVSIQLNKIADVSALVRVKRTRRLELAFELPAGYDYRAYLCNGLTWWELPAHELKKQPRR